MTDYIFILDKTSKKHQCPECQCKSFVRYVHRDTNEYELPYEYGRCDKDKCGYFVKVSREVIKDYKQQNNIKPGIQSIMKKQEGYFDLIPDFIYPDDFTNSLQGYENNPLVKFLYNSFETPKVDQAINMYNIGTSKKYNGGTVFWQVCKAGFVRSGSIMAYDYNSGKRKKADWAVTYVHSALNLKPFCYGRCLYGEHLLANNPKSIGIVESEKTAIIMSIISPEVTWLATSGKANFKYQLLSTLKPFTSKAKIIAYPDKGCYDVWNNEADKFKNYIEIKVSSILEGEEYNELEMGADIADLIQFQLTDNCQ